MLLGRRAVEVPNVMYVNWEKVNLQQQMQSAAKDRQYEFFQNLASSLAMIHIHSQVLGYNFPLFLLVVRSVEGVPVFRSL